MADISELLSHGDPDALKKLLGLRDALGSKPYDLAEAAKNIAPIMETPVSSPSNYGSLFNKQIAQDVVDQASLPGKSAASSAEVLSQLPEAAAAGGESMLPKLGRMASKSAIPLAAMSEFLSSTPVASDSEEMAQKASAMNPQHYEFPKDILAQRIADLKPVPGDEKYNVPSKNISTGNSTIDSLINDNSEESPFAPGYVPSKKEEENSPVNAHKALLSKIQHLQKTPTQNGPSIRDSIALLLGKSQDQFAAAQEARNSNQLLSLLGQAGSTIGSALTPLAPKADQSFWTNLQKAAGQPIEDLATKQALETGTLKEQILKGQAITETEQSDPTSAVSRVMRDLYKQETGKDAPIGMAYADIAKLEPSLARMSSAKIALAQHMDALKTKGEDKQANALKDTQLMIETARGAKDVQNARETIRLVDNVDSLLAEYPDLNKMPSAQISLFAQELGKIAKGGVAGEAEVRDIMPSSVASSIMKGLGQLVNSPTGAKLAAFLREYQPYLSALKNNSNKLINDRTERILKIQTPRLGINNVALMRSVYSPTNKVSSPDYHSMSDTELDKAIAEKKASGN
jgi:hypothetical protein